MKTLSSEEALNSPFNIPNPQNCPYCDRVCKNINSYKQHICRCKSNPNRIKSVKRDYKLQYANLPEETKRRMAWSRGLTKDTSESIRNQIKHRPKTSTFKYIYKEHNELEILKWLDYVNSLIINIPKHTTKLHTEGYKILSKYWSRNNNTIQLCFEHDFIMNLYLGGNLQEYNTVHHIDKDKQNNDIRNLITFETCSDHVRFHNSPKAWLIYNENTHKFRCIKK